MLSERLHRVFAKPSWPIWIVVLWKAADSLDTLTTLWQWVETAWGFVASPKSTPVILLVGLLLLILVVLWPDIQSRVRIFGWPHQRENPLLIVRNEVAALHNKVTAMEQYIVSLQELRTEEIIKTVVQRLDKEDPDWRKHNLVSGMWS